MRILRRNEIEAFHPLFNAVFDPTMFEPQTTTTFRTEVESLRLITDEASGLATKLTAFHDTLLPASSMATIASSHAPLKWTKEQ